MQDYSENNIKLEINLMGMPIVIDYIKQIQAERDYYKRVAELNNKLFVINLN